MAANVSLISMFYSLIAVVGPLALGALMALVLLNAV